MKRLLEFFKKLFHREPPIEERVVRKVTILIEFDDFSQVLTCPELSTIKKEKIVLDGRLRIPKNSGWRRIGERTEYHLIVLGESPSVVHHHS